MVKYADVNREDRNFLSFKLWFDNWRMIIEHYAILQTLGVTLDESVLESIFGREVYGLYFLKLTAELELAKKTKIQNCWVNCFDLLVDSKRKLKNYAGNEDLVEGFKKIDCLRMFPEYAGALIKKRVNKGIRRREIFDESSIRLSDSLPIFNPNHLIVRDVLDCLTHRDHQILVGNDQL